eukprot:3990167-Amphidinium_carterae.1
MKIATTTTTTTIITLTKRLAVVMMVLVPSSDLEAPLNLSSLLLPWFAIVLLSFAKEGCLRIPTKRLGSSNDDLKRLKLCNRQTLGAIAKLMHLRCCCLSFLGAAPFHRAAPLIRGKCLWVP